MGNQPSAYHRRAPVRRSTEPRAEGDPLPPSTRPWL